MSEEKYEGIKVLIVDDEPIIRETIGMQLELHGAKFREAGNGE